MFFSSEALTNSSNRITCTQQVPESVSMQQCSAINPNNTDSLMIYSALSSENGISFPKNVPFLQNAAWSSLSQWGELVSGRWSPGAARVCWEVISCLARPALWPNSPNLEIIIVGLPICTFTEMGQGVVTARRDEKRGHRELVHMSVCQGCK